MKRSILLSLAFMPLCVFGNGVTVSNIVLNGRNATSDYTLVNCDISWNNSWRTSAGPSNWDAAWVFIKYRLKTQTTWNHATLNWVDGTGSGDGHTEPANSNIASRNDNSAGGAYGVFIHRDADMVNGSVNYTGVKLRWNYGVDGLADGDSVEVCVFAIEMVYVPQGSFDAGDGTSSNREGHFENATAGTVFQITSEGALTLGGGGAGTLGNNNAFAMGVPDDFNDVTSQSLPAAFPKGYNAFYCMKYEISQDQYVAFLNKLTRDQQNARTNTDLATGITSVTNRYVMSNTSTLLYRNGIRCDATIHTSDPITFYCDLDGDGTANESVDGQNIACNLLNWADLSAYLDWAALRPMTELEYEKACRGTQAALADEYAWGSTSITQATGISNSGANNETASNAGANGAYGNHASIQGPMRVGNFGQGVNTREGVGASYYGIMELTGNLWDRSVSVGNATGRAFTGTHGNGVLTSGGDADANNWPVTDAIGTGFRGGAWYTSALNLRVSDRRNAAESYSVRSVRHGGRGIRVVP
ncbi:MAG: SUMF1/EgtB/PvdO family nonheme iron enzyme [Bacteroidetes bacterium]|nr:SUMF1/EgtB/PvdO family nonheme iron enzyme [Bacteroidota bacterium]